MNEEIKITEKDGKVDARVEASAAPVETHEYLPLSGMFEIQNPTEAEKDQLKTIWKFFDKEGRSKTETLWAIKQTENRLSAPRMGETRLAKIYQYAKLRVEIDNNEKLLNDL